MQIAGEYELERKHERIALEDERNELQARAASLQSRLQDAEKALQSAHDEIARLETTRDDDGNEAVQRAASGHFAIADVLRLLGGLEIGASPEETLRTVATAAASETGRGKPQVRVRPGQSAVVLAGSPNAIAALCASVQVSRRAATHATPRRTAAAAAIGGEVDEELERNDMLKTWLDKAATEEDETSVRAALARIAGPEPAVAASSAPSLGLRWWREALTVAPAILQSCEASGGVSLDRLPPRSTAFGAAVASSAAADTLRASAARGATEEVRRSLERGVSPAVPSSHDLLLRTALHSASAGGHEAACKVLLKHTAAQSQEQAADAAAKLASARDADPLARASAAADVARARGMLGRLLDAQDSLGCTSLALAARGGHAAVCKLLLLQGADPAIEDEDGAAPEAAASEAGHAAALRVLQEPSVLFWNASVRANRLYAERRYNEAIGAYSAALELASSDADGLRASRRDLATLHYNRARAAFRLGLHVAAVEDCGAALDQDDSYRNALAQRAECHMSLFDFERAAKDFRALLEADPSDRQWARRLLEAERMRDLSHYQVLGLAAGFAGGQLKRAYRAACLRWHPDKHSSSAEAGHRAHVVFRRVTRAYEVLKDAYQRTLHDMDIRARGQEPGGAGGAARFDDWAAKEAGRDAERDAERRAADTAMQVETASLALARRAARSALSARAAAPASSAAGVAQAPAPSWLPMALGAGGWAELAAAVEAGQQHSGASARAAAETAVQATQTTPTVSGHLARFRPQPPPLPDSLRAASGAGPGVEEEAAPSPAKSTSSSASRRSAHSSATRRAAEQAEAFLRRVQEREEARWGAEARGSDPAGSSGARQQAAGGVRASPEDGEAAEDGRATGAVPDGAARATRFDEAAEAKESAPLRRSGREKALGRAGEEAASSPRAAARMRVEARVRGRVLPSPLDPRAGPDDALPSPEEPLPAGLFGFVHQLDVLDAEIRAMMAPGGRGDYEEGGDVELGEEDEDATDDDSNDEGFGDSDEHASGEADLHFGSGDEGDDAGEDLERAFGYQRHEQQQRRAEEEAQAPALGWASSPAGRAAGTHSGFKPRVQGSWPVSQEVSNPGAVLSPAPAATPRTHEAARKAAEAALAPLDRAT